MSNGEHASQIARLDERDKTLAWRIGRFEEDVDKRFEGLTRKMDDGFEGLNRKVDRLSIGRPLMTWGQVSTLAVSLIGTVVMLAAVFA